MKICVSEATTMPATFAEDITAAVEAGCPALEVWLTKLETHLRDHDPADTRKLLEDKGIALPAAAYQGGLLLSQGEARKAHFDHFKKRLDLCQQFGIGTMLLAADFATKVDAESLERSVVSLKQAGQWAAGFGVRLALEFRAGDAFCSCLETALLLTKSAGEANVGVNLDLFHYFTGPSKFEDLAGVSADNLFWVQASDLSGVPRELASDGDRILPGDGDLPIAPVFKRVAERGYEGYVSLELMNPQVWQVPGRQVMEFGCAALRRLM